MRGSERIVMSFGRVVGSNSRESGQGTRSFVPSAVLQAIVFHRMKFVPILLGAFVGHQVLGTGLPGLLHDWRIPADPKATGPWLATFFEGWLPGGIGSLQAYPTFYLIGFLLWPLHDVANSYQITVAIVAITVALAAGSAMRLARNLDGGPITEFAVALFACLNPWVYSKYVAGHILMIFAYAVLLALLAEATRRTPRTWSMIVLAGLSISQIEFYLIAAPLTIAWAVSRRCWPVLCAVLVTALPIVMGMTASYGDVRSTPFNLSWQRAQSADLAQAVLLQGYIFDYARAFGSIQWVLIMLAVATLAAVPAIARDRRLAVPAAVAICCLFFASGTKGPFSVPYAWLVVHVPEIGVFRELYDLVGIVAIGYVVMLARGMSASRMGATVVLAGTAAFLIPWVAKPPSSFFVDAFTLQRPVLPSLPQFRVAFEPAFQPLTMQGRGSGVDPDAFPQIGAASPINEVFPMYPVDSALGFATFFHDYRYLQALAVREVIARPELQTDLRTLRYQWIAMRSMAGESRHRVLDAVPLLSISSGEPQPATIGNAPFEFSEFFADRLGSRLGRFSPDPSSNDDRRAWVDARLAVPMHPQWGNAYGGIATSGSQLTSLALPSAGTSLLAQTDDRIVADDGTTVVHRSGALHWWPLPPNVHALRCVGTCIAVLQAAVPVGVPEHRLAKTARAIDVHFITPWLGMAAVSHDRIDTLRLNVRYARPWLAFAGTQRLRHIRLDTSLNAWRLPHDPSRTSTRVVFIETVAAIQFLLEFASAAILVGLAFRAARQSSQTR